MTATWREGDELVIANGARRMRIPLRHTHELLGTLGRVLSQCVVRLEIAAADVPDLVLRVLKELNDYLAVRRRSEFDEDTPVEVPPTRLGKRPPG